MSDEFTGKNGQVYTEVTNNASYLKPDELPTGGKYLEAIYLGPTPPAGKYNSINHKFREEDSIVIVNGCGVLNAALEGVRIGTPVALSYKGKKLITSGKWKGTDCFDIDVRVVTAAAPTVEEIEGKSLAK